MFKRFHGETRRYAYSNIARKSRNDGVHSSHTCENALACISMWVNYLAYYYNYLIYIITIIIIVVVVFVIIVIIMIIIWILEETRKSFDQYRSDNEACGSLKYDYFFCFLYYTSHMLLAYCDFYVGQNSQSLYFRALSEQWEKENISIITRCLERVLRQIENICVLLYHWLVWDIYQRSWNTLSRKR